MTGNDEEVRWDGSDCGKDIGFGIQQGRVVITAVITLETNLNDVQTFFFFLMNKGKRWSQIQSAVPLNSIARTYLSSFFVKQITEISKIQENSQ